MEQSRLVLLPLLSILQYCNFNSSPDKRRGGLSLRCRSSLRKCFAVGAGCGRQTQKRHCHCGSHQGLALSQRHGVSRRVQHIAAHWPRVSTNNPPSASYHVYIDENGDAAGNYTVLSRGTVRNNRNQTVFGLLPAGTFSHKSSSSYSNSDALPVSNLRVCHCSPSLSLSLSLSLSDTIIPALICLLIPTTPRRSR